MSRWRQWIKEPKGALPGGIITKAGIALIGVLIAGMLFSSSLTGPEEDPMAPAPFEAQAVDDRAGRSFEGRPGAPRRSAGPSGRRQTTPAQTGNGRQA